VGEATCSQIISGELVIFDEKCVRRFFKISVENFRNSYMQYLERHFSVVPFQLAFAVGELTCSPDSCCKTSWTPT